MGLLSTIVNSLGLRRPVTASPPDAFTVTRRARTALTELPRGQCLLLQIVPHDGAFDIQFALSPPQHLGPSPHSRLIVQPSDAERIRGMILDHVGGQWIMKLTLHLNCTETPNPNGRHYQTNRMVHSGPPTEVSGPSRHYLANQLLANTGIVSVLFHHNAFTVERQPETQWNQLDQFVEHTLREALLRCAPVIEDAGTKTGWSDFEHQVWICIEQSILPNIHKDGGDLQLIGIVDGEVQVSLRGACASCPASTLTLKAGVERTLNEAFPDHNLIVVAI